MILTVQANAAHLPLADESVHCCVTSPPYWGLRDYGLPPSVWGGDAGCAHEWEDATYQRRSNDGGEDGRKQTTNVGAIGRDAPVDNAFCSRCGAWRGCLGLEPAPELFVEHLVAVFREVRRVLRPDGTCWVNLGSSYASSTSSQSQSRPGMRAPACDSGGIAPPGSLGADPASCDCDGEHQGEIPSRRDHIVHSDRCEQPGGQPTWLKDHDSERLDCGPASLGASLPGAQASTIPSSSANAQDACGPACVASGCRSVPQTSGDDDLQCAHRDAVLDKPGTSGRSQPSADRRSDKAPWDSACGDPSCKGDCGICWAHYTIPLLKFKAKDLVSVPWLVALALQADGWYLRSSIIWAKGLSFCPEYAGSSMPESVKDRPSSSHEHVFLLSKSSRYFYDAEAVREAGAEPERQRRDVVGGANGAQVRHSPGGIMGASNTRNLRNVWAINPAGYRGAHFATWPPALVEPMILAGCPEGGIVLDPFAGSGTTGMVAVEHRRRAVLCDLSGAYLRELATERTDGVEMRLPMPQMEG